MGLVKTSVYRHTQSTPATTWRIDHALSGGGSKIPVVDVFVSVDGVVNKIMPLSTTKVNDNTVEITFSVARTGLAVIIV